MFKKKNCCSSESHIALILQMVNYKGDGQRKGMNYEFTLRLSLGDVALLILMERLTLFPWHEWKLHLH